MVTREESAFWWLFRRFEKDQTMLAHRFEGAIDSEAVNTMLEYLDGCKSWAEERSGYPALIPQRRSRPRTKPTTKDKEE